MKKQLYCKVKNSIRETECTMAQWRSWPFVSPILLSKMKLYGKKNLEKNIHILLFQMYVYVLLNPSAIHWNKHSTVYQLYFKKKLYLLTFEKWKYNWFYKNYRLYNKKQLIKDFYKQILTKQHRSQLKLSSRKHQPLLAACFQMFVLWLLNINSKP